jgi:uncharacterized RDD family membrane protein YckC
VQCPRCAQQVVEGAAFCHGCGLPLTEVCPNCAVTPPPGAQFCSRCGTALSRDPVPTAGGTATDPAPPPLSCLRCQAVNDPGSRHCYSCGLPLEDDRARPLDVVPLGGGRVGAPAGFWVRVVASVVDSLILTVAVVALFALIFSENYFASSDLSWGDLLGILLDGVYFTVAVAAWRTTIAKRLLGLYVVRPDGARVGVGRALARNLATYLSAVLLGFGFLMVAFRRDKRALHDLICDTRVVRARRGEGPR